MEGDSWDPLADIDFNDVRCLAIQNAMMKRHHGNLYLAMMKRHQKTPYLDIYLEHNPIDDTAKT